MGRLIHSIRSKIIVWFLIVSLIPLIASSVINYNQSSKESIKKERESAHSLVLSKAQGMDEWLDRRMSEIELASRTEILQTTDLAQITTYLKQTMEQSDVYESIALTGADGVIVTSTQPESIGLDLSDRIHIQEGFKGNSSFSSIIVSRETGNRVLAVASPVKDENGKVLGIVSATANFEALIQTFLQNEESNKNDSRNIETMLVDDQNRLQVSHDEELIGKSVEEAQFNKELTAILKKGSRETDTGIYSENGEEYLVAYAPIQKTGYGLYLNIPMDTVLEGAKSLQNGMLIVMVIAVILVILLSYYISGTIAKPVSVVTEYVKRVANGDLTQDHLQIKSNDETGQLANAINRMQDSLSDMIKHISDSSENLTAQSEELMQASDEVKEGSEQIAIATQQLASGSVEQADQSNEINGFTKQLQAKIQDSNADGKQLYKHSQQLLNMTLDGRQQITQSVDQMLHIHQLMKDSINKVEELSKSSKDIAKLVTVIREISDQTNLLALNAAIEAARAGEVGKGFAVVAEEVRKLAEGVSDQVGNIETIVGTIQNESDAVVSTLNTGYQQVKEGSEQIQSTEKTFKEMNHSVEEISERIQKITARLSEINENSDKISTAIGEIASVAEESAASTEETSATVQQQSSAVQEISGSAESLAKLAEEMNELIKQFKI